MRVFTCENCGQLIFFDNSRCLRCDTPLGYVHEQRDVVALRELADGRLVDLATPTGTWQRCATADLTGCNWLVPAGSTALCASCQLTRTRPADSDAAGLTELVQSEMAKRRLVFQLAELGLPVEPRREATKTGLAFDLLSSSETKVVTGHDDGIITLDLAEADDEHRERLRLQLSEPYRTVLGHFRHEIGHYYWDRLVRDGGSTEACRAVFGDERANYAEALERHYKNGPPGDWSNRFISAYASSHPWEDFAETWAHYLHIVDALETARSYGIDVRARFMPDASAAKIDFNPYTAPSAERLVEAWIPLTVALNGVNRSMGHGDLYPFVLNQPVMRKLEFVHDLIGDGRAAKETPAAA